MRLIVLLLSMGSVVLFGYALAGMGGYLLGKGRLDYVFTGLRWIRCRCSRRLLLWKKYLDMILMEDTREKDRDNISEMFSIPGQSQACILHLLRGSGCNGKRTEQMRLPLNENDPSVRNINPLGGSKSSKAVPPSAFPAGNQRNTLLPA